MKTGFILIGSMLLAHLAFSQNKGVPTDYGPRESQYCAMLNNGKMEVSFGTMVLRTDVNLQNGSILTPNGTIVKKDGSRDVLANGQCVDNSGAISASRPNRKTNMTSTDKAVSDNK